MGCVNEKPKGAHSQPKTVTTQPPKNPSLPVNPNSQTRPDIKVPSGVTLPKVNPPTLDIAKIEPPKFELPKVEPPRFQLPVVEPPKVEIPKVELPKVEDIRVEHPIAIPQIHLPETTKYEAPKIDSSNLNLEPLYVPPYKPSEEDQPFGVNYSDLKYDVIVNKFKENNPETFEWAKEVTDEDYSQANFQPIKIPQINVEIK